MKIVQINTTCGIGSTGKICVGISQELNKKNIENYILFSSKTDNYELGIKCSGDVYIKLQAFKSKILGNYGFNSKLATKKMIYELNRIKPDIVHLHNLHGHDCDFEMLFDYLRNQKIKMIWTFHDCWAFTGYCPNFEMIKCHKWKTKCHDCPQRKYYSWFFDRSMEFFEKKKNTFSDLSLSIVTPSKWLSSTLASSFFKQYRNNVIYNGIDLSIFKPTKNNFRRKYRIDDKYIILGVSFNWGARKGLDVFLELAERLSDLFIIVLVGTDEKIDSKLPNNILSIHRTNSQYELAEIYSAANVFVNPTREEVLGLTNIEALACGTPGITFNSGGSPECYDETCGSIIECDDIDALEKEIIRVCIEKPYSREACINRAKQFDKNERYKEYLKLYERVITSRIERN